MSRYGVYFIPPGNEIIDSETLKKRAGYRSPLRLCGEDVMLLLKNWRLSLNVVLPMISPEQLPGVKPESNRIARDYCLMGVLLLIELPALFAVIPAYLLLPGWVFLCGFLVLYILIWAISSTMWGDIVVDSQARLPLDEKRLKQYEHEKWIFINGISTSRNMMERSCSAISATFKRPVTGIHNRSWGLIGDLIECLIQRSFDYETEDVRVAYESIKSHLEDEGVRKIVVLAHSQGGILISLVLDRLYASMPAALLGKMEIYTFGSAAAHFRNPLLTSPALLPSATPTPTTTTTPSAPASPLQPTPPSTTTTDHASPPKHPDLAHLARAKSATFPLPTHPTPLSTSLLTNSHATTDAPLQDPRLPTHAIPHIEHYVNSLDLVPRWGVLYHIVLSRGTHYSGSVFVHEGASGHLFDAHYLGPMFPLGRLDAVRKGGEGAGEHAYGVKLFLNHRVQLEADTRHDQAKVARVEREEEEVEEGGGEEAVLRRRRRTLEKATRLEKSGQVWRARTWGRMGAVEELSEEGKGKEEKKEVDWEGAKGEKDEEKRKMRQRRKAGKVTTQFTVKELSRLWRYMDGGMV